MAQRDESSASVFASKLFGQHLSGAALIFLGILAAPVQALIITSVDRATFQAAINDVTVSDEDFDGLAPGTILGVTPDVTYSSSTGSPVVTNAFLTSTSPNGLGRTTINFFQSGDVATFTFSSAITAFAIDINTFATGNGAYRATLSTGDIATSIFEVFPGFATGQFIGFVTDTAFTSVAISAATGFPYTLDTLVYGEGDTVVGPGTPVPEPGTLALLWFALALLFASSRLRKY